MRIQQIIKIRLSCALLCLFMISGLFATTDDSTTTSLKKQFQKHLAEYEKKKATLKKKRKAIEKKLHFKNLVHHVDSIKKVNEFIHQKHQEAKGSSDYAYNVNHSDRGLSIEMYKNGVTFAPKYEVFAWYPHWEDNYYEKLNYSLLTTIAYFSYDINPSNGENKKETDWNTTGLLDSTKKHAVKSLLTVSNFGLKNNEEFLTNDEAIETLIANVMEWIEKRESNGICLDFEGVAKEQEVEYTAFVSRLSQTLRKKKDQHYQLYMTVPSVNWAKNLDFEALIPMVDRFIIMGYGYYGPSSKVAGPVANLNSGKIWEPYNLSLSVDYYLSSEIPASKLIVALPFYGSIWETKGQNKVSEAITYIGSRTYDYIKTNVPAATQYDSASQSAWCSFIVDTTKNKYRQCWFDNDSTLSVKLNYIKSRKLAGIGIWALGYDKGYPELWDAVAKNMCDTIVKPGFGVLPVELEKASFRSPKSALQKQLDNVENLLKKVTNYKTVLLYTLSFVVFFGGSGFLIAMFKPETRIFFFGNTANTVYYTVFVLLFLIVILRWTNVIKNGGLILLLGFIVGGLAVARIKIMLDRIYKDKP